MLYGRFFITQTIDDIGSQGANPSDKIAWDLFPTSIGRLFSGQLFPDLVVSNFSAFAGGKPPL